MRRDAASGAPDAGTQFAALPWRLSGGKPRVLLVTSRGTGRWIVPKGWPIAGLTPAEAAAREAWEEAGAKGEIEDRCLGLYPYIKILDDLTGLPCTVALFPLRVRRLAADWPEAGSRRRKWMSRKKAAASVAEPELARLLASFEPRAARR